MRSLRLVFTLVSSIALATALSACGGDDDDGDGTVDAGDTADAPTGADAPPSVDAPPATSAENLAVPCDQQNPCPDGEDCISVLLDTADNEPDTGSFCTVPCEGQNDTTSCTTGYTGPGQAVCALGEPPSSCAVLCDVAQAPQCPTGTECIDATAPLDDNMGTGICAPAL